MAETVQELSNDSPRVPIRPRYSEVDNPDDVQDDTVYMPNRSSSETQERLSKMEQAFKAILECIGEDPEREGLKRTPLRAAKAMLFFTKGYEDTLECQHPHSSNIDLYTCIFNFFA